MTSFFLPKGGRLPQDETAPLSQVIGSYFDLRTQNLNLRALSLTMNGSFILNSYCTNISFYLVLKAKRIPAHNHPVIERLLTYRNVSAAFPFS